MFYLNIYKFNSTIFAGKHPNTICPKFYGRRLLNQSHKLSKKQPNKKIKGYSSFEVFLTRGAEKSSETLATQARN